MAVSMHKGWQILSALRSDSREWPRRMGVCEGGGVEPFVEKGLDVGGDSNFKM